MDSKERCTSSLNEQLYLVEIFVINVDLVSEKFEKEDLNEMVIDVKFIDCPVFEIQQAGFELTKNYKAKEVTRVGVCHRVNFNAGAIYMFPKNPKTLVEGMKSEPMLLNVYKIKGKLLCPPSVIKDPLAYTLVPLTGCLCDQLTMADNESHCLPKPYKINNTFCLLDKAEKPAGVIALFFCLTCIGKYVTSQYCILEKSLLFKNYGFSNEFQCIKIPFDDEQARKAEEEETLICLGKHTTMESKLDSPPTPQNIIGLAVACQRLTKQDGHLVELITPMRTDIAECTTFSNECQINDKDTSKKQELPWVYPIGRIHRNLYLKDKPCQNVGCMGGICSNKKYLNIMYNSHKPQLHK